MAPSEARLRATAALLARAWAEDWRWGAGLAQVAGREPPGDLRRLAEAVARRTPRADSPAA